MRDPAYPSPGLFGTPEAADQEGLAATFAGEFVPTALMFAFMAAFFVVWWFKPLPGMTDPAWLQPALVAVLAVALTAVSAGYAIAARHCRRTPGALAGVAGELAEVAVVGPREGVRLLRVAATNEGVDLHFLRTQEGTLPQGTCGVLYWSGRTAAYVTDTGTFWAI